MFSDVNIATERHRDFQPSQRFRGGFSGHGGRRPSPPFRHRDRFEMERPMRWERERMGWRESSPPLGPPPFRNRERDFYYDRFPPPPMRDPYNRPRDDSFERYPPRDRERFPPPRDMYGPPPRDTYAPPPPPRDRYGPDYPRGSPEYDRGGHEDRERDKRPLFSRSEPDVVKSGVDLEIIVINRQQR